MFFLLYHHVSIKYNFINFQMILRFGLIVIFTIAFSGIVELNAQNTKKLVEQAYELVNSKKIKEAYKYFQSISESQVNEYGDSCIMLYNYGKGACLYYMDKYEEAIPFLQKGLRYMEKLPHEDCHYLEMLAHRALQVPAHRRVQG